MTPTEPIVLLGPTVIMQTTAFLVLAVTLFFALKYGERFYRKYLTNFRFPGTLFHVENTMNLPATKLTVTQAEAFQKARQAAISIGKQSYFVTADDVYFQLQREGVPVAAIGPAAGNIFRNKSFAATDIFVKSQRPSNRGRKVRQYVYIGA